MTSGRALERFRERRTSYGTITFQVHVNVTDDAAVAVAVGGVADEVGDVHLAAIEP